MAAWAIFIEEVKAGMARKKKLETEGSATIDLKYSVLSLLPLEVHFTSHRMLMSWLEPVTTEELFTEV